MSKPGAERLILSETDLGFVVLDDMNKICLDLSMCVFVSVCVCVSKAE